MFNPSDGSVYPNRTSIQDIDARDPVEQSLYYDNSLHVGNVVRAYPPSDVKNKNKKKWEYDVLCIDFVDRKLTQNLYTHCIIASSFGGSSDTASYTLRAGSMKDPDKGSKVLLLSIGGIPMYPIIISTLNFSPEDEEDHMKLQFRNAQLKVNQKGAISTRVTKDTGNG